MKTLINLNILILCSVCIVAGIKLTPKKIFGSPRILGGDDADEGQFPYQVSLRSYFSLYGDHWCGGSIISDRFILSAAHCTQAEHSRPMYLHGIIGTIYRFDDGVHIRFSHIINHPAYDNGDKIGLNDISILRTTEQIVFTNLIQPIALPINDSIDEKNIVIVSGFGYTSSPSTDELPLLSDVLKFTKLSTISQKTCLEKFKYVYNINEKQLCTIGPINVGICHGDSGGPLVDSSNPENKVLVGIISWGIPCGKGWPDVYTRVYSYLDWIQSEMENLNQNLTMKCINLIILIVCGACVVADIELDRQKIDEYPRILGGEDAEQGQFPYQVSLRCYFEKVHLCGGAIVSNRFILTAAHCTQEMYELPQYIYAVVGALKLHDDGIVVRLSAISNHAGYDRKKCMHDIALLRTAEEIVFTNLIQPIALPTHDLPRYEQVIVSGWGSTSSPSRKNQRKMSDILKFGKPSTLTYNSCTEHFKMHPMRENVHKTHICTISPINFGVCYGDSGGPLADVTNPQNKTLIGIVSWGIPCGKGFPDVYTRIYLYLDWIHNEMIKHSEK
ncbi:coagulation factor IX-like [Contarinia nasturtii]|uniref:coagulation factor IX-like n=1 Tax=Contarinia nasturtii TaxID=265458 RepID=UPI0012D4A419|nr:coagulation factor IX-like [Contarinia nasturtii]